MSGLTDIDIAMMAITLLFSAFFVTIADTRVARARRRAKAAYNLRERRRGER